MRRFSVLVLALCAAFAVLTPASAGALLGRSAPAGSFTLGGKACDLIPTKVTTAAPVGAAETCPGVRPGAVVTTFIGQCTLNFLFQDTAGNRYIGTAGHCAIEAPEVGAGDQGEHTWAPGAGPVANDADGNRIGTFVYAILQDPKDFSLIKLDAGVQSSPQMCHFGGPTGINSDNPGLDSPTTLEIFGQGVGVGTVLPARSMLALGMPDPDHVYAQGVVVPGDSGSGVISADGRAIGVAVTTGVHTASFGSSGIDAGEVGITRLAPQLARANQVLGLGLTLVTAPTL